MKKVLIVEDDPFIRDITTIKLSSHPYEVQSAQDGKTAISLMAEFMPDVVLLDLNLPDISGVDVLVAQKGNPALHTIQTIIFSNNDDEVMRKRVIDLGIAGFFIKVSTDYDELYALIDSL